MPPGRANGRPATRMASDDGWTFVRGNSGRSRRRAAAASASGDAGGTDRARAGQGGSAPPRVPPNAPQLLLAGGASKRAVLDAAVAELAPSPFLRATRAELTERLARLPAAGGGSVVRVVAYGLGCFCSAALGHGRFQAALLADLVREWGVADVEHSDPAYTDVELEAAEALGWRAMATPDDGRHVGADDGVTLFYMPHCPWFLYDAVLQANADRLDRVAIIGNSFAEFLIQPVDARYPREHIAAAAPRTREWAFGSWPAHPQAFQSVCLITFDKTAG